MRTLLVTLEYPPFRGGVAAVYGNLVKYYPESEEIFVLDNSKNRLLSSKYFPNWLPAFWSVWKEIRERKIEHVIVGQVLPLGTVVYLLSYFLNIKYTVIFHGMDFDYGLRQTRKKRIMKRILTKADKIICMNSYVGGKVRDFINEKEEDYKSILSNNKQKVFVVNPGIGIQYQVSSIKHQVKKLIKNYSLENKFVVFSLGRLVKRKGQDKMIEVMNSFNFSNENLTPTLSLERRGGRVEKYPNIWYYIAGAGPDEEYLKELAKENERVVFLGKVSEEEKKCWLSLCDVFAMPAREIEGDYEGFGVVYLEANLMGKPVIAGRSGGVTDAVEDYENGILCNPESPDDIKEALLELYNDWNLRHDLGQRGMERVIRKFDVKRQVGKIYDIISRNA